MEKLWVIYRNKISLSLEDLLKKDETVNIHQRNLEILATWNYQVKNDWAPDITNSIFVCLCVLLSWMSIIKIVNNTNEGRLKKSK